jgi:hypothetical protein
MCVVMCVVMCRREKLFYFSFSSHNLSSQTLRFWKLFEYNEMNKKKADVISKENNAGKGVLRSRRSIR